MLQFRKILNVYFKIRFGNPAICPNIEIRQPLWVGVHQAKASEGAPTPAVLLGLGYSQIPLTQFSYSCVLTSFWAANNLRVWAKCICQFGMITCHLKLLQVITGLSMCRWRQKKEEIFSYKFLNEELQKYCRSCKSQRSILLCTSLLCFPPYFHQQIFFPFSFKSIAVISK